MALATKPRCCCSTSRWPAWGRRNPRAWWRCCAQLKGELHHPADRARHGGGVRAGRPHHACWSMAASSRRANPPRSAPMPPCAKPISARGRSAAWLTRLLESTDVETSYGLSRVLFGMSLAIAPGEMVSLMGRNGMGKTTTVRSIMGLTPRDGRLDPVRRRGHPRHCPSYRVAKLGIGLVPEGRQVFPNLTARENLVATAANRAARRRPWTLDKVCALFPRLAERAGSMANLLSGGEQQMLAIGRALMTNPRLLILDEATEGPRAADPRRDLALPAKPARRRAVDPGDRQERRRAHPYRRPPLHHRARPGGVVRQLGAIGRRAGHSAPLSGGLTGLPRCPEAAKFQSPAGSFVRRLALIPSQRGKGGRVV